MFEGAVPLIREVFHHINTASNILILSHEGPDADAYGSSLALARIVRKSTNSVVKVLNVSPLLPKYAFIPDTDTVVESIGDFSPDIVIYCDCGDEFRVGDSVSIEQCKGVPSVNIDHHVSNSQFGTYNLVKTSASSTSEIIYNLAHVWEVEIDPETATCLLAGIIGDTGSFRYASTSSSTLRVAAALVDYGADIVEISSALFSNVDLPVLQFQATVINSAELFANGAVAISFATLKARQQFGVGEEGTEGIAERLRDVRGVEVSALARELEGTWRISLRSTSALYDVSKVASSFGGGGHRCAAAFRWSKGEKALRDRLVKALEALVEEK